MEGSKIIIVLGITLLILIAWGLIGSSQASKVGTTCDLGVDEDGSVFCWKWHRNVIGDAQDTLNDFFEEQK